MTKNQTHRQTNHFFQSHKTKAVKKKRKSCKNLFLKKKRKERMQQLTHTASPQITNKTKQNNNNQIKY